MPICPWHLAVWENNLGAEVEGSKQGAACDVTSVFRNSFLDSHREL